jgi:hypothetical protein
MAISKKIVVDQITVAENGSIYYREATQILQDGAVLAESFHRTSLQPGDDLTGHPERVVAIAGVVWTPEVVAAYKAQTAEAISGDAEPVDDSA